MATLRGYASRIQSILKWFKTGRENKTTIRFLADRINDYRSKEVRDSFSRNMQFDVQLIQDLGVMPMTLVTSQDDPSLPFGAKDYGKITLPTFIDIPGMRGVYRIASPSKQIEFEFVEMINFHDMPTNDGYVHSKFCHYTIIGNSLYTKKYYVDGLNIALLLDNPLDAFIIQSGNIQSGDIIIADEYTKAESYKVVGAAITYEGNVLLPNATFTGNLERTYVGPGTIQLVNQKRRMNLDDQYPMSATMFEVIFMKILTKDFEIEKRQAADIVNDAQTKELIEE